jgi:hypothetical protein
MITKEMYGTLEDGNKKWSCIYTDKRSVSMCGIKQANIVKLKATEDENGEYWGWLEGDEVSMVWNSLSALKMCFTYGIEIEEKAGKGRRIRLKIEPAT